MSFLNDVAQIFVKYYPQLLSGVGNTMLIALVGTVAGLLIGPQCTGGTNSNER